ncbi:hypothetical protein BH09BAC1_BH09BAC1_05010 [soil metagenome]
MLNPACNITIGSLQFDSVNEVRIESRWKEMTDKCLIKQPRNIKLSGKRLQELINVGDAVKVMLGYDGTLIEEFRGYVVRIKPTTPIEIECEDEMWQLKKGSFTNSWKSVNLDTLLKYFLNGRPFKTLGTVNLGKFTLNKATPAQCLEEIKKCYGLHSFFRNGVLIVGKVYDSETTTVHQYHFQKNVLPNPQLEFRSKEEMKVKVEAISILKSGDKIEEKVGDDDGEERTLHFFNLNKADLLRMATIEMAKLKYDGYRGKMVAFGWPAAQHGDVAELDGISSQLSIGQEPVSDHKGKYYIDGVIKNFGLNGYKRELEIGPAQQQAMTLV